jgi:GT2 family glycosyltransferase
VKDIRPVSVIICTHNRAERLPKLIGLLRAQDYPQDAYEIIVVDNRSTDHTSKVVQQLAAEPGIPVRYVFEHRHGVSLARNRGAEEAHYPYLAYIDDDCSIRPGWLPMLMSGFDLHECVVAVGGLVVLQWEQDRPAWLNSKLDIWLADTSFLGHSPRLLKDNERLVEANTVFERQAWQAAGGFVGMEQFGSQNMASGEVLYLLRQLRRQGGKVAFIPEAVMYHHINAPTRQRMLQRAYWQGISDAILTELPYRRSFMSVALNTCLDLAALLVFLGWAAVSYARRDSSMGMFHLIRAVRRIGFLLSETRIVGDWQRVYSWSSKTTIAR